MANPDKVRSIVEKFPADSLRRALSSRVREGVQVPYAPDYLGENLRLNRQRYAESAFNDRAKSPAGATGAYQIMPITQKDYLSRGKGTVGDLLDPNYNRQVRDFALDIVQRDLGDTWSDNDSEEVRLAKRYAGYNWGAGSLKRYLRKQRNAGVDISNSLDWMSGLPKETKDYVDFIVLGNDVPGTNKTMDAYRRAWEKYSSEPFPEDSIPAVQRDWTFADGGNIYWPGGGLAVVPEMVNRGMHNLRQKIADTKVGQVVARELGIKPTMVDLPNGESVPVTSTNGLLPWLLGGSNPSAAVGRTTRTITPWRRLKASFNTTSEEAADLTELGKASSTESVFNKARFRDITNRLRDYRESHPGYNIALDENIIQPIQPSGVKLSADPAIATLEKDLADVALHGGFRYSNIGKPTLYDPNNPMSFFDAAEDVGFDVSKLLRQYDDYASYLTGAGRYRPYRYTPGHLLNQIRSGRTVLDDNKIKQIGEIVDAEGNVNTSNLSKAYKSVLREIYNSGESPHSINEQYGSTNGRTTLKKHISDVVKTAQQIPVPKGSSRQELVRAALAHDIGKLVTGQETATAAARHAIEGENLLRTVPELANEFSSPTLRSSVLLHMDDEVNPIFGSHGIGKFSNDNPFRKRLTPEESAAIPEYDINWDLLHALQASDVSRGLHYDAAAMRYPQLFMYDREIPLRGALATNRGFDWELRNIVNPIFKRQGYPVAHNMDEVMSTLRRHNSFYRGVRDPLIPGAADYGQGAMSGNSPEERMQFASENVSPVPSSSGRAELFGGTVKDGRPAYNATKQSKHLKASPDEQDAIYVSVSPNTATAYATPHYKHPRSAQISRVRFPVSEPEEGESLASLLEKNDFNLLSATEIGESGTDVQPMGTWQMFEQPYRLQTGRSLQADMSAEFSGRKFDKLGSSVGISPSDADYQKAFDAKQKMSYTASLFGGDISWFMPEMEGKIFIPRMLQKPETQEQRAIMGKFAASINIPAKIASSYLGGYRPANVGIQGLNELERIGSLKSKQAIRGYKALVKKHDNLLASSELSPEENLRLVKEYANAEVEYLRKYIFNDTYFKRQRKQYFDLLGEKKTVLSQEYKDYIKSPEKQAAFMREHGVLPLWDLPSFGKHVLLGNGAHRGTWTSSPRTRNKPLDRSAAQGYIIGKPGEKLLDTDTVYPGGQEGLKEILDNSYVSRFRDDGVRYLGEDPRYWVTRKTYPEGGLLLHDYRTGGKIHIKPENRGKFTALKKRTGHSASWFKAHGTPAQKKMAVFALNARKWKHGDGGLIERMQSVYGDDIAAMREAIQLAKSKK